MKGLKRIISLTISICILGVQVTPGYSAFIRKDKVRVAYLGIHFEGVELQKKSEIEAKVSALLEKKEQFNNITQEEIANRLNVSLLDRISQEIKKEDLRKAAEQLNADYIFTGNLQNQSKTPEVTALVGVIARYDRSSDQLYKLNLKSFYESFIQDLATIDQQLVQTIVPQKKKGFFARHLPGIVIVAATVVAAALLLGNTGGQGSGGGGGQRPPFTVH